MAKTVVGLFDDFSEAQRVVQDLVDNGFARDNISLVANDASGEYGKTYGSHDLNRNARMDDTTKEQVGSGAVAGTAVGGVLGLLIGLGALAIPGIGPVLAAGPLAAALGSTALGAGIGAAAGGLIGPLVDAGIPRSDAELYNEGIRRGGTLVLVRSDDDRADEAADILARYDVVDIDQRGEEFSSSGYQENAEPYTTEDINRFRTTPVSDTSATHADVTTGSDVSDVSERRADASSNVIPVVEEELQISKRQVQRGGARIHTRVTEQPVEEQVQLRDETVRVERRPVNRPVSDADLDAFKEGTIEITETDEEAVVAKQARVVEEIVVDKDVQERTETVRDTVRRTDVDVEQLDTERAVGTPSASGYDAYDTDFRKHYQTNFANSGQSYESYGPVYRYGYNLGSDKRYSSGEWTTIEPEARRRWEEQNPGTWEQFKDTVRYAWDKARGRA